MIKHCITRLLLTLLIFFSSTVQATEFDIKQYQGKVIYLDFWASWCVPCRDSFPWMNKMHQELSGKGLVIIAVNLDKEKKQAEKFLNAVPADFKIIYDPEAILAQQYEVKGMPSSYLFDRNGKLVKTHIGFKNKNTESSYRYIESVLEQSDGNK